MNKLGAMTADNVNTNAAIGQILGDADGIDFDHTNQVHGCVAHVINLAAKDGLKVFGEILESDEDEDEVDQSNPMALDNLVDPPNVRHVNLKTIYH